MGRGGEAQQAYNRSIAGIQQLSGDRDSWNSENFFMVLSLARLHRSGEADKLEKHFVNFADTERDSRNPLHRSEARYLLGLTNWYEGRTGAARTLFAEALEARPDLLPARLDLRGDTVDLASGTK